MGLSNFVPPPIATQLMQDRLSNLDILSTENVFAKDIANNELITDFAAAQARKIFLSVLKTR